MRLPPHVLFATASACGVELALPPDIKVRCASDAECPADLVCSTELERCIPAGENPSLPALTGLTAAPAALRAGATLTVGFAVNKPLPSPPEVQLVTAADQPPLVALLDAHEASTGAYVFVYTALGNEPEGEVSVRVRIADAFGNEARAELRNATLFDFTAPLVEGSAAITLRAAPGNPLASEPAFPIMALGAGARASVTFTASEDLAAVSTVELTNASPRQSFARGTAVRTTYTYDLDVSALAPNGAFAVDLLAADLAGNTRGVRLGSVTIDTVAPAPPDVDGAGVIVHRRVPWGATDTSGVPAFSITGAAGAAEADGVVFIFDQSDGRLSSPAGVASTGAFGPIALERDQPRVWLRVADRAGNLSPRREVREGEWVATLIGADQPAASNPNVARAVLNARPVLGSNSVRSLGGFELAAAAVRDGQALALEAARLWRRVGLAPRPRYFHASAYDRARGELLLTGGTADDRLSTFLQDTWIWNGTGFREVQVQGVHPSGRFGAAMAYDPVRRTIVMFGGRTAAGPSDETWIWNGNEWLEAAPGARPDPRYLHAMAYDEANREIVLFGGCIGNACSGMWSDTWVWNGSSWRRAATLGPPGRAATGMAYHAASGGVVMHAGCDENNFIVLDYNSYCDHAGNPDADTWMWDGTAWSTLAGPQPPQRAFHQLATDAAGVLYAFGGCTHANTGGVDHCGNNGEVWCMSAGGWSAVAATGNLYAGSSAAYDFVRRRIVLSGGFLGHEMGLDAYLDVTEWSGSCASGTLEERVGTSLFGRPSYMADAGAAYVPALSRFLFQDMGGAATSRSWSWSGASWDRFALTTNQSARSGSSFVFVANRNRLVQFGGGSGAALLETFEVAPTPFSTWAAACTSAACRGSMLGRADHAAVYDGSSIPPRMVVFGGGERYNSNRNDLWAYNGSAWSALCTACAPRPSARRCAAMAHDSARDALVLFGGATDVQDCAFFPDASTPVLADTWEWRGAAWSQRCTGACVRPPERKGHALVFDTLRARTVLVGGLGDDVWEWNGDSWIEIPLAGARPLGRMGPVTAFDPVRGVLLMYGGRAGNQPVDDLWELELDAAVHPAIEIDVHWPAALVSAAEIVEVELSLTAGGRGFGLDATLGADNELIGDPAPGVGIETWTWLDGFWSSENDDVFDTDDPQALVATIGGARAIDLVAPADDKIRVRAVPTTGSGNGPSLATVALDYFEATVRYRRPAEPSTP